MLWNFISEKRVLHSSSEGVIAFCLKKYWYAQTYAAKGISLLAALLFAYIYEKSAPKPYRENKSSNQQLKKEI